MWGAMDSLIATAGWRGATRKANTLATGTLTDARHMEDVCRFERLLWINAVLDIGYALGGALFIRRNPDREGNRGHGAGVIAYSGSQKY